MATPPRQCRLQWTDAHVASALNLATAGTEQVERLLREVQGAPDQGTKTAPARSFSWARRQARAGTACCGRGSSSEKLAEDLKATKQIFEEIGDLLAVERATPASKFVPIGERFPLVVMRMSDFLELARMTPYPELERTGRLQLAPAGAAIHFISHQWLGNYHPDPKNIQLKRMQLLFMNMMRVGGISDVFSEKDWDAFSNGSANKTHAAARQAAKMAHRSAQVARFKSSEKDADGKDEDFMDILRRDLLQGFVWLDYACIPQIMDYMNEEERALTIKHQTCAINSISTYIESATYFYVCAPAAEDEKGRMCDFGSWMSRGWCRLEDWANFLCPTKTMMPIVVTEEPLVSFLEFFDFFLYCGGVPRFSVFNGDFKCCQLDHMMGGAPIPCDRVTLTSVVSDMYDRKLESLLAAGNEFLYRIYKVMEPSVMAGSSKDRMGIVCSPAEPIDRFLERFVLPSDPLEGDSSGAPAIEWASFLGHSAMVSKLIAARCPADLADKGGLTPLIGAANCCTSLDTVTVLLEQGKLDDESINAATKGFGITALDRAAKGGQVDVVKLLIARRASMDARRKDGRTPLLSAAEAGHCAVCKVLLECRACVHDVGADGQGVLHLAAHKFTAFGGALADSTLGGDLADVPALVQVLLAEQPDPWKKDGRGQTPLQVAVSHGTQDVADQLLVAMHAAARSARSVTMQSLVCL